MTDLARLEQACEAFMRERAPQDPAHDISHIKRVVNNARYLTDLSIANELVTIPSAWLHDCVQTPKDSPGRALASTQSAAAACRFLSGFGGFPKQLLPEVQHAVEAHSFSANIPVRTLEAGVVQDADRLDALGAVGIARCLLTGGALGSGLHHPTDPFCQARPPDDRAWAVDHFFAKLFALPATMHTEAGRREAERRVQVMRDYLAQLGSEIGAIFPADCY